MFFPVVPFCNVIGWLINLQEDTDCQYCTVSLKSRGPQSCYRPQICRQQICQISVVLMPLPPRHTHTHTQNLTCKFSEWAAGWIIQSSTPGRGKRCFCSSERPDSLGPGAPSLMFGRCGMWSWPLTASQCWIKISGAVPLHPLCAFILWTGTLYLYHYVVTVCVCFSSHTLLL